jgi:ribosome-binding ATPase YchF (GTP1/OBG family)
MKLGMIGLPRTGKKTLFRLLTGHVMGKDYIVEDGDIISFRFNV